MHVASIRDVKFLPVIFYVNFTVGLILSHVLHSFSHLMKLLPLLMIPWFFFSSFDGHKSSFKLYIYIYMNITSSLVI